VSATVTTSTMHALPMITPNMVSAAFTLSARKACTATRNVSPQTIENFQSTAGTRRQRAIPVFSEVPLSTTPHAYARDHPDGYRRARHADQHHLFAAGDRRLCALPPRAARQSRQGRRYRHE